MPEEPTFVALPVAQANALYEYLMMRPMREVEGLVAGLRALRPIAPAPSGDAPQKTA